MTVTYYKLYAFYNAYFTAETYRQNDEADFIVKDLLICYSVIVFSVVAVYI